MILEQGDTGFNNNNKNTKLEPTLSSHIYSTGDKIVNSLSFDSVFSDAQVRPKISRQNAVFDDYERPNTYFPFINLPTQSTLRQGTVNDDHEHSKKELSWRNLLSSRSKLRGSSTTSELLAGFALVTMVELQINYPTEVPDWLFILFAINTTVVVSMNIFAIMISSYLLPRIEASAKLGMERNSVEENPHENMRTFIELAWIMSNILGLFLFLVQLAILLWVKFWDYSFNAALYGTILIVPFLITFAGFATYFYHSLLDIKVRNIKNEVFELEEKSSYLNNIVV